MLNESKYSMPRVRCAFGNVFIVLDICGTVLAGERANINCSVRKMLPTCCIWDLFSISHQIGSRTEGIGGTRPKKKEDEEISRSLKTTRRIIHEIMRVSSVVLLYPCSRESIHEKECNYLLLLPLSPI